MKTHNSSIRLVWDAPEYIYIQNHPDWFWGIGLISLTGMVLSFMAGNMLFLVIIAIATFLAVVFSLRHPEMVHVEISDQGVLMDTIMHPFTEFKWFWICDGPHGNTKLILYSERTLFPTVTIPVSEGIEINQLRSLLKDFITEHEIHEPYFHRLLDKLGF